MKDLFICLRVYPKISKEPFFQFSDKLQLFRVTLLSLKDSLGNLDYKIAIIFDNCPDEYFELAEKIFGNTLIKLVYNEKLGNEKSFMLQLNICCEQKYSENVFLVEDDYLFSSVGFDILLKYFARNGCDFLTPYDHSDYYNLVIHKGHKEIEEFMGYRFKTVNSTTLSFLTRKQVLIDTLHIFSTFIKKNNDASIFWSLTKTHVLSIQSFILFVRLFFSKETLYLKLFLKSWIYNSTQILWGKKYVLKTVSPSIATHMQTGGIAPNVDWGIYLNKYLKPELK